MFLYGDGGLMVPRWNKTTFLYLYGETGFMPVFNSPSVLSVHPVMKTNVCFLSFVPSVLFGLEETSATTCRVHLSRPISALSSA